MNQSDLFKQFNDLATAISPNWGELRVIIAFGTALVVAYLINRAVAAITPRLARIIAARTKPNRSERFIRTRRTETYLSLAIAISRVIVFVLAIIVAWRLTTPTTAPIALVGASTIFIILASATVVPLLRDITYGFVMIAEHWYNVGDHVVVEPFPNLGGVVEEVTLRSTKLRSMNGEVIWLHNQHIQAVRVSAAASHTMAIETFFTDQTIGRGIMEQVIKIMPHSPITIPQPLHISEEIEIESGLWRITAICEVTPYREWIIEVFAVNAIKETAKLRDQSDTIVYGPVAYYADVTAEKRFKRSVRSQHRSAR